MEKGAREFCSVLVPRLFVPPESAGVDVRERFFASLRAALKAAKCGDELLVVLSDVPLDGRSLKLRQKGERIRAAIVEEVRARSSCNAVIISSDLSDESMPDPSAVQGLMERLADAGVFPDLLHLELDLSMAERVGNGGGRRLSPTLPILAVKWYNDEGLIVDQSTAID